MISITRDIAPTSCTFQFSSIAEGLSRVDIATHETGEMRSVSVAVNDHQLIERSSAYLPSRLANLIDIATAVYAADRLGLRRNRTLYGETRRNIEVILPVRNPDYFNQPHILERLSDTLYWYTEDNWTFKFEYRDTYGRSAERQPRLIPSGTAPDTVILWSGGLDSLAGACNLQFNDATTRVRLLGTGGDKTALGRQTKVASILRNNLGDKFTLRQVPLHLHYGRDYKIRDLNRICRSRGFVFLLLGAVTALLEGCKELLVCENGVGAINLNFSGSELGLDHTRSVHPISLIEVSDLISELAELPFAIRNPFLFQTKAQMCEVFHWVPERIRKAIPATVSCDRPQRRPGQRLQCGHCSSCLLRHMGLIVSGIGDYTLYNHPLLQPTPSRSHYWAMSQQVETLRASLENTGVGNNENRYVRASVPAGWDRLALEYADTLPDLANSLAASSGSDISSIQQQIVCLYRKHIWEWDYLQREVEASMLIHRST